MRKIAVIAGAVVLGLVLIFGIWLWSRPQRGVTGEVSTKFRWLGPNDRIVVEIADDGPGMPDISGPGFGLRGMTERVKAIGGSLILCNRPEGGLAVTALLP